MYYVVKALSNNLILAVDGSKEEAILSGKGIGFNKKKGDKVTAEDYKVFKNENTLLTKVVNGISNDLLLLTSKLVQTAEHYLGKNLNPVIYITLSDHLKNAIDRITKNNNSLEENMYFEIPYLYSAEFRIAKKMLKIIEQETKIEFPNSEASFIALHLVNAQDEINSMSDTVLITSTMKSIIRIIQSIYGIQIDKQSIEYSRFVTHIRYLIIRQMKNNEVKNVEDIRKFYHFLQAEHPKSFACSLMIREELQKNISVSFNENELTFLMMHIIRLVS